MSKTLFRFWTLRVCAHRAHARVPPPPPAAILSSYLLVFQSHHPGIKDVSQLVLMLLAPHRSVFAIRLPLYNKILGMTLPDTKEHWQDYFHFYLGTCVSSGCRLQGFRVFLAVCPVGGPRDAVAIRARSVTATVSEATELSALVFRFFFFFEVVLWCVVCECECSLLPWNNPFCYLD